MTKPTLEEKWLMARIRSQTQELLEAAHGYPREYLQPWPPEKLVGALQDNIHREVPEYRIPRSVKVDVPMKELTSSLDVELEELVSYLIENQQPLEPEFQKVLDDNFWDLLSE
jgi:hypothetical protein